LFAKVGQETDVDELSDIFAVIAKVFNFTMLNCVVPRTIRQCADIAAKLCPCKMSLARQTSGRA